MADDEEFRQYFPERQMDQFIRENRAAENEGENPLNDRENVIGNDDVNANALRDLLSNYFVHNLILEEIIESQILRNSTIQIYHKF